MSFRHIFLAILVAAIWGFNFIVLKVGLKEMHPYLYGAGRFFIVALPILFIKKPKVSWPLIVGVGLMSGLLKFTLMSMGVAAGMAAGLASLVLQSQAFFTLIFSVVLLKSKIRLNQVLGMLIAFAGMILIGWQMQVESSLLGFIFIIAAAICWGILNIIYRKAGDVDMFALTVWSSIVVPLPLLCISLHDVGIVGITESILSMSFRGWICLAYTACLASWIGSTLWAYLMRCYEPHMVAPFSLLIPVFGIIFANLFLDERFTLETAIASVLIFSGLMVNQWRTRKNISVNLSTDQERVVSEIPQKAA
ncbi:EamA family transporter [Candidatus Odyssella acanthamoebae]|uniref:EamA family transporter n=1 Tax=Candidatus Odyssella acanthamoebae TaxID=91604 RepID=UPI0006904C73|nr:EamA family transporter [Candidatus Paracaedibacter acanthamoebae]